MKKISIIGCGTIGTAIAKAIDELQIKATLVSIYDINRQKAKDLHKILKNKPEIKQNMQEVFENSDMVVEAAHQNAVKELLEHAMKFKRDVFVMSTGGLLKNYKLYEQAKSSGVKVYYPSGAIVGLDGISSASVGKIKKLILITKKPPQAFKDNKYLRERGINPEDYDTETTIFKGNIMDALEYFPENINVSATLCLSGVPKEKIAVKIITSKKIKKNIHFIRLEGEFGSMRAILKNNPSETNPKTSKLAIFSAISKLKEICE